MPSFPYINTPNWADILLETLRPETGGWNWKIPFALARYFDATLSYFMEELTPQNYLPISASFGVKRVQWYALLHNISYFVWKETFHKPLRVPSIKLLFSSVYVTATTCFDECFLFYLINGRHCFSWKFVVTIFFKSHVAFLFETSVLKEVRILCVISTITIPKFQNKSDYTS